MDPELARAITATALGLGIDPIDLATAISYETAGTFDPWKAGPTTQWGQHRGLIQWGEPQRRQYGVFQGMPVSQQMNSVAQYLTDAGVRPGMGLMDLYSAINAGQVGRYGASDGPGNTVRSHVQNMSETHRPRAAAALGGEGMAGPTRAAAAGLDPSNPLNMAPGGSGTTPFAPVPPPPPNPISAALEAMSATTGGGGGSSLENAAVSRVQGPFAASMEAYASRDRTAAQARDFLVPLADQAATTPEALDLAENGAGLFGAPAAATGPFGAIRPRGRPAPTAPLGPGMRIRG